MRVAHNRSLPSAQRWMRCPERGGNGVADDDADDTDYSDYYNDDDDGETNDATVFGQQPTQRSQLVAASGNGRSVSGGGWVLGFWIVSVLISTTMAVLQRWR